MPPKIVVITGPTASGKTRLGVELCLRTGGEVVSADSMQVYRRMDIGTAKPTAEEMRGVPHHMLDVCEPEENFSVSRYVEQAARCVDDILQRGRIPFLVGGTGLYIDSLLSGRDFAPGAEDGVLRAQLEAEYDALGGQALLDRLAPRDPASAARLHPNDKKRVVRALEVLIRTGESITEHDRRTRERPPRYEALKLVLCDRDRERLYARIDRRVDEMLERGLAEEVRALLQSGVPENCTAMQAIGYKEIAGALRGRYSFAEAAETVKRESRRYAKRQLSWFRRDPAAHWLWWDAEPDFAAAVQNSTACMEKCGIL